MDIICKHSFLREFDKYISDAIRSNNDQDIEELLELLKTHISDINSIHSHQRKLNLKYIDIAALAYKMQKFSVIYDLGQICNLNWARWIFNQHFIGKTVILKIVRVLPNAWAKEEEKVEKFAQFIEFFDLSPSLEHLQRAIYAKKI